MSCDITYSPRFARELKKLSKHYKSLKLDYANLLESLKANPEQGVSLGNNLRKVRMAITSKNKGKSGGARVITYTVILTEIDSEIKLLTIYDKSECLGLQCLQDVQNRAGSDYVSTQLTLEDVKKEKSFEMWLEGVRFPDMVRWGDTDG